MILLSLSMFFFVLIIIYFFLVEAIFNPAVFFVLQNGPTRNCKITTFLVL